MLPNRKSEGFPGFGYIDTMKADQKSSDNTKIKRVVSFPQPTATKSPPSPPDCSKDFEATSITRVDLKVEKTSPTPEQEETPPTTPMTTTTSQPIERKLSGIALPRKTISVRTDLVELTDTDAPACSTTDEIKPEHADERMDIEYDQKTVITPHESIPDVRKWDIDEVYTYFLGKDTPEFAQILKEHQIDGDALLLIKREDVLDRFNLKLGAALRLYAHIVSLQYKNNNPILAWNEF